MNNIRLLLLLLSSSLILWGCYDVPSGDTTEVVNLNGSYAVPLVNTTARILDIEQSTGDNTSILVDDEGKVTIFYNGNVIRNTTATTFPPVPGIVIGELPLPAPETVLSLEDLVPFEGGFILNKATFTRNSLQYRVKSAVQEKISIRIFIPQITKNGAVFSQTFDIHEDGIYGESFSTPYYDLEGWTLISDDNNLSIFYEATTASGDLITLDEAGLNFSLLAFKYIEGFFTQNNSSESGEVITIGVYSTWISGGFDFEDPKLTIKVQNSFGFPVRTKFNKLELTNVKGEKSNVEGTFIDEGFDFNYPTLDEKGTVAYSEFILDKTNSNIQTVFNEKVKLVRYDVTATGNPDNDDSIIGFLTDTSFYNVDIAIELPLETSINDLILGDTFDIDLSSYEEVINAEFKLITENKFPYEMEVQAYMLDANGVAIDSLFRDEAYQVAGADTSAGSTNDSPTSIRYTTFDNAAFAKIRSAEQIAIKAKFNNTEGQEGPQWIYEDYGIDIKIGAIINVQK